MYVLKFLTLIEFSYKNYSSPYLIFGHKPLTPDSFD